MAEDSVQGADAWKQKAPYLTPGDSEDFKIQYMASCTCGEVKYAVDTDPVAAKYCHCTSCQTLHGMLATLLHIAADRLDSVRMATVSKIS